MLLSLFNVRLMLNDFPPKTTLQEPQIIVIGSLPKQGIVVSL